MTEEKLASAVFWARGLVLLSALVIGAALAADDGRSSLVEDARAANDRYTDRSIAAAERYAPICYASGALGGAFADTNRTVTCQHASTD
jgi:hypothetical protein